ncbi:MAG: DUF2959 family protein [Phycisphaerales bacterium]
MRFLTHTAPAWLVLILLAAMSSCRSPPSPEPFARDRLGQVCRAISYAATAQGIARDQLNRSLDLSRPAALGGTSPRAAFDSTRKDLMRSAARIETAAERVAFAQVRVDDLIERWDKELGSYEDPDLRDAAERNLRALSARLEGVMKALETAQSRFEPVSRHLADRMLLLSHQADRSTPVEVTQSEESRLKYEAVRADMNRDVGAASDLVDEFNRAVNHGRPD